MLSVTKKVNDIYKRDNPSLYLKNFKLINKFVHNRINLLMSLKLPQKIFNNTTLIDYGSGTGLNTLVYSYLGANCTLVEYDKKSFEFSNKLFKKFSKNKYKIFQNDLFNFKTKKKFDFVVSNGVAHHTKNPYLNLKICIKSLKKKGFFILGLGETNGFFQRNLQRLILYKLSNNENEIKTNAKFLFGDHLKRSKKFSGRTINEIIADTYLNPKINTLSLNQLLEFLKKNKLELYSYYGQVNSLNDLINSDLSQFKLTVKNLIKKKKNKMNLNLNDIQNFSLSNDYYRKAPHPIYTKMNKINIDINKLTTSINDIYFNKKKMILRSSLIKNIYKKLKDFNKIDILNKKHNLKFLQELLGLVEILNLPLNKDKKKLKVKKYLFLCKVLLKGLNGTGMNYLVAYKK